MSSFVHTPNQENVYYDDIFRKCLINLPDGLYEIPQYILVRLNFFDTVNDGFQSQPLYYKIRIILGVYLCCVLFVLMLKYLRS